MKLTKRSEYNAPIANFTNPATGAAVSYIDESQQRRDPAEFNIDLDTVRKQVIYDSAEQLMQEALECISDTTFAEVHARWERNRHSSDNFLGRKFRSWQEVFSAATEGDYERAAEIDRMAEEIKRSGLPQPKSRKRKRNFSEMNGDDVDYDRLRAGQPYWVEKTRETHDGPATITIVANMATPGHLHWEDVAWRSAAAIALTKILEEAGYRVELWLCTYGHGRYLQTTGCHNRLWATHAVRMKQHDAPLNLPAIAAISSGWAYRTIWFAAIAQNHEHLLKANWIRCTSVGAPMAIPREVAADFAFATDEELQVLDDVFGRSEAIASAARILNSLVDRQAASRG